MPTRTQDKKNIHKSKGLEQKEKRQENNINDDNDQELVLKF